MSTQECEICCDSNATLVCGGCKTRTCSSCLIRRGTYPLNACPNCDRNFTLNVEDATSALSTPSILERTVLLLRPWMRNAELSSDILAHLMVGVQGLTPFMRNGKRTLCDDDDDVSDRSSAFHVAEVIALESQSITCNCGARISIYDINFEECMALSCTCGLHLCAFCSTQFINSDIAHDHLRLYHTEDVFCDASDYFRVMVTRARAIASTVSWILDADLSLLRAPLRETFRSLRVRIRGSDLDAFDLEDHCRDSASPPSALHLGAIPSAVLHKYSTPVLLRSIMGIVNDDLDDVHNFIGMGGCNLLSDLFVLSAGVNTFPHDRLYLALQKVSSCVAIESETDAQLAFLSTPCMLLSSMESVTDSRASTHPPTPPPPAPHAAVSHPPARFLEKGWTSWSSIACDILSHSPLHASVAVRDVYHLWRKLLRMGPSFSPASLVSEEETRQILVQSAETDAECVRFWMLLRSPVLKNFDTIRVRFVRALNGAQSPQEYSCALSAVIASGSMYQAVSSLGEGQFIARFLALGSAVSITDVEFSCTFLSASHAIALLANRDPSSIAVLVDLVRDSSMDDIYTATTLTTGNGVRTIIQLLSVSFSKLENSPLESWERFDSEMLLNALQRAAGIRMDKGKRNFWRWITVAAPVIAHLTKRVSSR